MEKALTIFIEGVLIGVKHLVLEVDLNQICLLIYVRKKHYLNPQYLST